MTIRLRLLLAFLLLVGPAFYYFIDFALNNVRPRYLETVEESLNDSANVLAALVELDLAGGRIQTERVRALFERAERREFSARIYDFAKSRVDLRAYVTDDQGRVLYDSGGQWQGLDFSRWNDVYLTLRGKYGARSTRGDPQTQDSGAYYVAAPVRDSAGRIVGVVSVSKRKQILLPFIEQARTQLLQAGLVTAGSLVVLLVLVTLWITRPIAALHNYVDGLRRKERLPFPKLHGREIRSLGRAFDEMRRELEGKQYVENYVQTFTHELKSPLTALRAAAELLGDELSPEDQTRFARIVRTESGRIEDLVQRMLQLSALENRTDSGERVRIRLCELLGEVVEQARPMAEQRSIELTLECAQGAEVLGERFLLFQAFANVVQNALEFTPAGGRVEVKAGAVAGDASSKRPEDAPAVRITVEDTGSGVPDFAVDRVFDRFYSLPRPGGQRSTGLGLAFVREAITMHGGTASLYNSSTGATAEIVLPSAGQPDPSQNGGASENAWGEAAARD